MKGNFIDLVLCRFDEDGENRLFYAPAFSWLQKGDVVVVDSIENWERTATVVAVLTVGKDDSKTIDFVLNASKTNQILGKVRSKLSYVELKYNTDEEKEENVNEQSGDSGENREPQKEIILH